MMMFKARMELFRGEALKNATHPLFYLCRLVGILPYSNLDYTVSNGWLKYSFFFCALIFLNNTVVIWVIMALYDVAHMDKVMDKLLNVLQTSVESVCIVAHVVSIVVYRTSFSRTLVGLRELQEFKAVNRYPRYGVPICLLKAVLEIGAHVYKFGLTADFGAYVFFSEMLGKFIFSMINVQYCGILELLRYQFGTVTEDLRPNQYTLVPLTKRHHVLLELTSTLNEIFSWQLLVMCTSIFINLVTMLYVCIGALQNFDTLQVLGNTGMCLWQVLLLFSLAVSCEETREKSNMADSRPDINFSRISIFPRLILLFSRPDLSFGPVCASIEIVCFIVAGLSHYFFIWKSAMKGNFISTSVLPLALLRIFQLLAMIVYCVTIWSDRKLYEDSVLRMAALRCRFTRFRRLSFLAGVSCALWIVFYFKRMCSQMNYPDIYSKVSCNMLIFYEIKIRFIAFFFVDLLSIVHNRMDSSAKALVSPSANLELELSTRDEISKILAGLNRFFGKQMLLLYLILGNVLVTSGLVSVRLLKTGRFQSLLLPFVHSAIQILIGFLVAHACETTKKKAESFNNDLFKLMRESKDLCSNEKLHLYVTMKQTLNFTACGFFTIGYPLVTSIIAAATTYLVILVQFSMTDGK
ncbi:Hypothetical protein NTJ_16141 [Nesidiocoris tenuis]|uniref:Gustatory receptor n=1 Tax=Nesidiocoris tenuis TaxID=355587 RepID=A0ABN7BHI7_9HEMI|nr:Hypothetical protein NTJ_16141 [Nesidiocoris tenuis]